MLTLIQKYFPNLSSEQLELLNSYAELLKEWNTKINLISRKDVENIEVRHILHSLSISKVIQFKAKSRILDAGTGGGLPGVPLAIMFPEANFHLVDARSKKVMTVEEMCKELGLKNTSASHERIENLDFEYDFIISRAVTRLDEFLKWTFPLISKKQFNDLPNGIIYLKGGDVKAEVKALKKKARIWPLREFYSEAFFEEKVVVYLPGT